MKGLKELALLKHVLSNRERRSNGKILFFLTNKKKNHLNKRRTHAHTNTHTDARTNNFKIKNFYKMSELFYLTVKSFVSND